MNPDLPPPVQAKIESICELGCDRVMKIINALEAGDIVEEVSDLDNTGRHNVLVELKAIMAVYVNHRN
jgi:hypothetical protein